MMLHLNMMLSQHLSVTNQTNSRVRACDAGRFPESGEPEERTEKERSPSTAAHQVILFDPYNLITWVLLSPFSEMTALRLRELE